MTNHTSPPSRSIRNRLIIYPLIILAVFGVMKIWEKKNAAVGPTAQTLVLPASQAAWIRPNRSQQHHPLTTDQTNRLLQLLADAHTQPDMPTAAWTFQSELVLDSARARYGVDFYGTRADAPPVAVRFGQHFYIDFDRDAVQAIIDQVLATVPVDTLPPPPEMPAPDMRPAPATPAPLATDDSPTAAP